MANRILVTVHYDQANNRLHAHPPEITLHHSDDWVQWQIESGSLVPAGASLAILFEPPLGPFQTVRSFDSLNLAAKGNIGPPAPGNPSIFPYRLFLIPENLPEQTPVNLATGGPFTVDNQSPDHNFSPWLTVTYNGLGVAPSFDPQHLLLFDGDIAFWKVEGLSPDHIVAFRFADPPHFPGPFPTYFSTRAGGHGDERLGVANFGCVTGSRNYVVEIWDQNGHLLAETDDPSVDGLGRPPGT